MIDLGLIIDLFLNITDIDTDEINVYMLIVNEEKIPKTPSDKIDMDLVCRNISTVKILVNRRT